MSPLVTPANWEIVSFRACIRVVLLSLYLMVLLSLYLMVLLSLYLMLGPLGSGWGPWVPWRSLGSQGVAGSLGSLGSLGFPGAGLSGLGRARGPWLSRLGVPGVPGGPWDSLGFQFFFCPERHRRPCHGRAQSGSEEPRHSRGQKPPLV